MKNIGFSLTFVTFFCVSFFHSGAINAQKSFINIPLRDGRFMQIQACEDHMERYGILKTDWDNVQPSVRKVRNTTVFATSKNQLIINNETGNIILKDHAGKVIIPSIQSYLNGSHPLFGELQNSLLDYSGKIAHGGGVIGDANYTGIKDSSSAGGVISASVTEFGILPDERFYGGGTTSRKNIQHRGEILRMWTTYQRKRNTRINFCLYTGCTSLVLSSLCGYASTTISALRQKTTLLKNPGNLFQERNTGSIT